MDNKTLIQLQETFKLAPSAPLGEMIVLTLIEIERIGDLHTYVESEVFTSKERITIGKALYEKEYYNEAIDLLDDSENSEKVLLAKCYHRRGDVAIGRRIYDELQEENPSLLDRELEDLFQSSNNEKVKLKVVEKEDYENVIDMTRYQSQTTNFDDVVGLADIKKQINKKIIMPFQKPSLFARFKKKVGGGVLLYGPPGCGKTLLARATAGECNAKFFNIEISDVLDMYIGESEQKLHDIFEKARGDTPSVLFFDEIEALAGKREYSKNSSNSNVVSQFLMELDGFSQNNKGVLVLAATNVPWAIDPAFLRPGRFDRMFFVPPPDKVARQAILEHHMKDRPADPSIDFKEIAYKTPGYSGADIENLIDMAVDEAIDETIDGDVDVMISSGHFKEALQDSRATTTEWLTTARNYARYANDGGRYDEVLAFLKKHGK